MLPISERAWIGEERLMLAVLIQQIIDYVNYGGPASCSRKEFYWAEKYLFEDGPQSENYVFGLIHTCQYFGYRIKFIRGIIQEMRRRKYRIKQRGVRDVVIFSPS